MCLKFCAALVNLGILLEMRVLLLLVYLDMTILISPAAESHQLEVLP